MSMNEEQFMDGGRKILNFITEHLRKTSSNGSILPSVDIKPGFFWKQVPNDAPEKGETFDQIFEDFKSLLVPGVSAKGGGGGTLAVPDTFRKLMQNGLRKMNLTLISKSDSNCWSTHFQSIFYLKMRMGVGEGWGVG